MPNYNNDTEDALFRHLNNIENKEEIQENHIENEILDKQEKQSRTTELQYISPYKNGIKDLPCGEYYLEGTEILIRAAQVREVQAFSIIDENNPLDAFDKIHDMLSSCVKMKIPGRSKPATYLDLRDGDRLFVLLTIRDITFQQRNHLTVDHQCSQCGNDMQIDISCNNFSLYEMNEQLKKYFDNTNKSFHFELLNGKEFDIKPPSIGLAKCFTDFLMNESRAGRKVNTSFLKIVPYLVAGKDDRNHITEQGIKQWLKDFESMDMETFQFLNSIIDKMPVGIKDITCICDRCGAEVHTDMRFPNGIANLFAVPDAIDRFIKN